MTEPQRGTPRDTSKARAGRKAAALGRRIESHVVALVSHGFLVVAPDGTRFAPGADGHMIKVSPKKAPAKLIPAKRVVQ